MSQGAGIGNLLLFALPILLIGFMFYTQRRRQRDVQAVQSGLKVGDEISTTSGLLGRITALDERIATLEISPGVAVRIDRRAIAGPAPTLGNGPLPGQTPPAQSKAADTPPAQDGPPGSTSPTS